MEMVDREAEGSDSLEVSVPLLTMTWIRSLMSPRGSCSCIR